MIAQARPSYSPLMRLSNTPSPKKISRRFLDKYIRHSRGGLLVVSFEYVVRKEGNVPNNLSRSYAHGALVSKSCAHEPGGFTFGMKQILRSVELMPDNLASESM